MNTYFLWGSIGVLAISLIVGLLVGLVRGLKRSSLHLIFFVASVLLAFFIAKPVTNAILGVNITMDGTSYTINELILKMIQTNFDISSFETAREFILNLPNAIISPFMFLILTTVAIWIFDVVYLIVARLVFGPKKKDFEKNKPYRAYGAIIGLVEGFMCLFILFAPITSLTKTYAEISDLESNTTQTAQILENTQSNKMKTIGETVSEIVPQGVNEAILAYNNSVIGKISGAGGLDNALFDYMSNFELNGEKIEFRKELVSMTSVYDEFVVVYNNVLDNNYSDIDLSNLKMSLEDFLNKGMFKTLVADTVNDIVVKFDTIKESMGLSNLPPIVQDIIADLQTVFEQEGFSTYEYLKNDILKLVDTFDVIFQENLISKYQNIEDKSLENILTFVDTNSTSIGTIAKDILKLNLVKDSFNSIGKLASQKIEEMFTNEEHLEIALNTNITNKDKMIDDVLGAVDKFLELNKKISISDLLSSSDIVGTITNITDLDGVLTSVGETFDNLRNLEILTLPATETRLEKVYVLDNILKIYGLDLLGDEVYLTKDATTKTPLNTYSAFFNYIKTPIMTARDLGLTDIGKDGVTFDTILDNVLTGLSTNEELLADIMLPFYQLNAMDLKTLVFDNIIDQLSSNISMLDFEEVKSADDYKLWKEEFKLIGKTLNNLNFGDIEGKTYVKYLLSEGADIKELMQTMLNDGKLSQVFKPIFTAKTFKSLTKDIFDTIDSSISDLTGSTIVTFADKASLTKLEDSQVRTNTISTIEELLAITLNNDLSNANSNALTLFGQVLEVLRVNAYNEGAKDGVFNEIFTHVVWYMTGDNISGDSTKFDGLEANSNANDIKKYIGITDPQDYYTYDNFESVMAEIQDVLDFADMLSTGLDGTSISDTETYANKVKELIDAMDKTETEKVTIINNMTQMLTVTEKSLLTNEEHTQYDSLLETAITNVYGEGNEVGTALISLFTYNPTTTE
ncbi:MAG: hypothetical protein ACI4R8_02025 [Candidatus Caccovivens sp.]